MVKTDSLFFVMCSSPLSTKPARVRVHCATVRSRARAVSISAEEVLGDGIGEPCTDDRDGQFAQVATMERVDQRGELCRGEPL